MDLLELAGRKAFAVLEEYENTGSIIFAKSNVEARRLGANEHACGDFSAVSCRRAPWADKYANEALPVSVMVEHGWHFECGCCGRRIDSDYLWEADKLPEDIIGHQHSIAYCDAVCEARDKLDRAERRRLELRWLRRFSKIVCRRFPDAKPEHDHAYATRDASGKLRIVHVAVSFDFPGREYGMARLRWRERSSWEKTWPKPHYTCSNGDLKAFETWAAAQAALRGRAG